MKSKQGQQHTFKQIPILTLLTLYDKRFSIGIQQAIKDILCKITKY